MQKENHFTNKDRIKSKKEEYLQILEDWNQRKKEKHLRKRKKIKEEIKTSYNQRKKEWMNEWMNRRKTS